VKSTIKPASIEWAWYIYEFDSWNPTAEKFIHSRWQHRQFCRGSDITLTAEIYLDALATQLRRELQALESPNKRSLIFGSFLRAWIIQKPGRNLKSFLN
jgi:hypothetical protein